VSQQEVSDAGEQTTNALLLNTWPTNKRIVPEKRSTSSTVPKKLLRPGKSVLNGACLHIGESLSTFLR